MSLRFIYQHSHFDDAFLNPKISGEGNILASGWSRLRRMEKLSCFNSSQRSNDRQKPISYPDGTWGDVNIFISGIAIDDGRVILRSEILTIDTFRYPKKNTRRGNSFLQSIIFRFHSVNFREEVDTSRFSTIKCSNASFPGERRILFFLGLQKGSRNPLKLVRHVHVGKPWAVAFCLSQHIVLEFGGDFLELFGSAEAFRALSCMSFLNNHYTPQRSATCDSKLMAEVKTCRVFLVTKWSKKKFDSKRLYPPKTNGWRAPKWWAQKGGLRD